VEPQSFTLRGLGARVARVGDVWRDLHAQGQSLEAPLRRLGPMLSESEWSESLAAVTRRPKPRKR
jgi:hypothetical protein